MVFSKNGTRSKNLRFTYDDQIVEIIDEFKYLGVIFKSNGRFISAIKLLFEQAKKSYVSYNFQSKINWHAYRYSV